MIFTLQYQTITLFPGVPDGYQNHHLHGTTTHYFASTNTTLFLQEIQLGRFFLQYLLLDLATDMLCQFRLEVTGNIVWICLRGNCMINTTRHLSEGSYHHLLFEDPLITVAGSEKSVTVLLILHLDATSQVTTQRSSNPSVNQSVSLHCPFLSPSMLDAAIQLIQTSYYPEPLPFHIALVQKIEQLVLSQTRMGNAELPSIALSDIAALSAARDLITKPFQRSISLAEIARHCGLNREKLRTGFKALFGTTVAAFIRQYRLNQAREQLLYTHKPLKEIARNAGYRNLSNFCTACKKMFGMSPGEMRRKNAR